MAAVGFDLYSRLLAEAVESRKASMEGRAPIVEAPQAVIDLPVEAHLPDEYVPDEAQKLELYRRLARARTGGDLAAFRQEVIDRYGPMPDPVVRLIEVAELRLAAEAAGVASISREEGWLVVRFGARADPGDRDAPARRAGAARPPAERRDVREQPGPAPAAGRPAQGLDADPGRRRAPLGRCGVALEDRAHARPHPGLLPRAYRHDDRTAHAKEVSHAFLSRRREPDARRARNWPRPSPSGSRR